MPRSPRHTRYCGCRPHPDNRAIGLAFLFVLLTSWHHAPTSLLLAGELDGAPPDKVVRVVTLLTEDDEGNELRFPSSVAYDRDMQEIYVVNGGRGGIVIYDADFFPHLFVGAGRGIDAPQGIFFDKAGMIYVCQGRTATKPPRLTILNAALFIHKEITFETLADEPNFSPMRGVVGLSGDIYLVGTNTRGAAVFNKEGTFLRWLKPQDRILRQEKPLPPGGVPKEEGEETGGTFGLDALMAADAKQPSAGAESPDPPSTEAPQTEPTAADSGNVPEAAPEDEGLPMELRPKRKNRIPEAEKGIGLNPVQLAAITTDSDGHLFLLSEESSKVYVYGADETFLLSFGQKGGSTGKLSRPRGIAIDETKKSIYVLDYMRHVILAYDYGGNYMTEFGGRGSGPLWFNFPSDLGIDREGRLLIADLFNNRIQVLKPEFTIAFPKYQGVKSPADGGGSQPPTPTAPPADESRLPTEAVEQQIAPITNQGP